MLRLKINCSAAFKDLNGQKLLLNYIRKVLNMLKIKMIMAALLAIGFASHTFAGDESDTPPVTNKSSKTKKRTHSESNHASADVASKAKKAKWDAKKCKDMCTENACKGIKNEDEPINKAKGKARAVECAQNCKKPESAATMVDCVIPVYAANCLNDKRDEGCRHISNGVSAITVGAVYLGRKNEDSPAKAAWEALKALDQAA